MAGKKYWVYGHSTEDDEMVDDLGEFDTLTDALREIGFTLGATEDEHDREIQSLLTYHIVDNATSTTVWIAGPGNCIDQPKGWSVMDETVSR